MKLRPPALWPRQLSLESIRGRLALIMALAFLPAGVMAFQAGLTALSARAVAAQSEVGATALRQLSMARDEVTQLRESTRTLAVSARTLAANPRACSETLRAFSEDLPPASITAVLNAESVVICSSNPGAQGRRTASGPLLSEAARRGDVVSGFIAAPRMTGEPVIAAVAPATQDSDARALFVGVTRPAQPLLDDIRDGAAPDRSFAAIVTRNGEIAAQLGLPPESRDASRLGDYFRESSAAALGAAFRLDRMWAVAAPYDEDAQLYLVEGWVPAPLTVAEYARAIWALSLPIMLWLAAVAAAWYAVELFVARPLQIVENLARSYARGEDSDAEEALLQNAPQEISSLRRTLAAMAKTLRGRETRLAIALQEERALLLEVNHRVKNNLQLVASILSIQARGSGDAQEARGLSRAQDRVQLLALAHAHIYASGEVRDIALDEMASEIVRALVAARGADAAHIALDLDLSPVRASADRAVPLSFLIGESVLTFFEMGAKSIRTLRASLGPQGADGFEFVIAADAGAGQADAIPATSQRLIGAFARQIGATVETDPKQPFFIRIERSAQALAAQ